MRRKVRECSFGRICNAQSVAAFLLQNVYEHRIAAISGNSGPFRTHALPHLGDIFQLHNTVGAASQNGVGNVTNVVQAGVGQG